MKRNIITIDQEKCDGCGACASGCPEGALRVIDGKARLVGDLLCDGLGACIGSCPQGAISIEEREAVPYDEIAAIKNIIPQGLNVILAHLQHLRDHRQEAYLKTALAHLRENKIAVELPSEIKDHNCAVKQCPGSTPLSFPSQQHIGDNSVMQSQLTHWPVQLHLISPSAPHYQNSDLLIAADCVAYSLADFHQNFLKGRTLAIACSKLDARQETYVDKIQALIDVAGVKSIKVLIMQVPCCSGLLRHVVEAASRALHKVPVSCLIVGLHGEVLSDNPIELG
jgi:NAD-dependent dihydropyrimidine dehydrogenase PreA subunit